MAAEQFAPRMAASCFWLRAEARRAAAAAAAAAAGAAAQRRWLELRTLRLGDGSLLLAGARDTVRVAAWRGSASSACAVRRCFLRSSSTFSRLASWRGSLLG